MLLIRLEPHAVVGSFLRVLHGIPAAILGAKATPHGASQAGCTSSTGPVSEIAGLRESVGCAAVSRPVAQGALIRPTGLRGKAQERAQLLLLLGIERSPGKFEALAQGLLPAT